MKKILTIGILLLFIGLIFTPLYGGSSPFDDTTPPVTTHSLDPPEPDGDNNWYVSNVTVTLNATDDLSGVKTIYYRISEGGWKQGEWKNYSSDIVKFVMNHDCLIDGLIEYYAVDYAGNQEEIKSFNGIDIDQLPPEANATLELYKEDGFWYVDFILIVEDACSGCVCRIEFFINDGLQEIIEGRGPDYVFTIQWSFDFPKHTFWFYCYDEAGNVAIVFIDPSDIKPPLKNQNYFEFFLGWLYRFSILQKILTVLGSIYFW